MSRPPVDAEWPEELPPAGRCDIVVAVRSAEGSIGSVIVSSALISSLEKTEQLDRIALNLLSQMP